MLERFRNHRRFLGMMWCWGVPMPPAPRDRPRVFHGLIIGSFMCGFWRPVDLERPAAATMNELIIDAAFIPQEAIVVRVRDYSRWPAGRKRSDGNMSAERFREDILEPEFVTAETVGAMLVVDLTGTLTLASNWLDEAFGGMVDSFTADRILSRMKLVTQDASQALEILQYIEFAEFKKKTA